MATYPQTPEFRSIELELHFNTDSSESDNGYEQAASRGGCRIMAKAKYNKLTYREAIQLRAFLVAHRGSAKTFDLVLPVESSSAAPDRNVVIQSTALHAAGLNSVSCTGPVDSVVRYAGEFIQFAGHDKAYMLIEDLVTDANGYATATFEPSLYEQILEDEQVITNEIKFKATAQSDIINTNLEPGRQYTFSVDFKEAIR